MNKVYFVMRDDVPVRVFLDKREAHGWAEGVYGSKNDGICVPGIHVHAAKYELV